jgi:Ion channel
MDLLFPSFTTLSSTGSGDIVPIRAFARGRVMLEMVSGAALRRVVEPFLLAALIPCSTMHMASMGGRV